MRLTGMSISILVFVILVAVAMRLTVINHRTKGRLPEQVATWGTASFVAWTLVATFVLGYFLLHAGAFFSIFGESFSTENLAFDTQTYVGLIAIIAGIPLAITSAFFAIYLSQASLAISKAQIELTNRQLVQDHPFFGSFSKLWVLKERTKQVVADVEVAKKKILASDFSRVKDELKLHVGKLIDALNSEETSVALILYNFSIESGIDHAYYKEQVKAASSKLELVESKPEEMSLEELRVVLNKISALIPDRSSLINKLKADVRE